MKLVKNTIDARSHTGSVSLIPTDPEDLWHLYNLIRQGDRLRAPAIRRVVDAQKSGATSSEKVRTNFTIRVKNVDFDPTAGQLHVSGQICEPNPYASIGQHHTLDLELNRQCTLSKGEDDAASGPASEDGGGPDEAWDAISLQVLKEACDVRRSAEVWAVVMADGLANICVITEHQTVLRQRVEQAVPRKRTGAGADAHDRGVQRFYETLLQTLLRQIDFAAMQASAQQDGRPTPPLLLASPGFTAQGFQKYFVEYTVKAGDKALGKYARENVLVAHSSNGHVHALNEVLKQPAVLAKLSDTKYARESALMERFFELIRADDGRAWYGPKEVERAVEKGAVGRGGGVLLINNSLFRSQNVAERRRWVGLVERVGKVEGGEVRVLSSAHESGKRLESLGNIGAILTFPCPDLADDDEEEDDVVQESVNGHDRSMGDAEEINL